MDGYTKDSQVVQWFWEIVSKFTEKEKRNLLFFVTGNDRIPLNGLSSLKFRIQRSGDNDELLPSAHTCFNIVSFPEYSSKEILKNRFAIALENVTGFNLAWFLVHLLCDIFFLPEMLPLTCEWVNEYLFIIIYVLV